MNNIMQYVPKRGTDGKFVSKKSVAKYLFVVIALVSIWGNYQLAKKVYNFKCSEGGYFTTKVQCDQFAQAKMNELEVLRLKFLADNSDLFDNDIQ